MGLLNKKIPLKYNLPQKGVGSSKPKLGKSIPQPKKKPLYTPLAFWGPWGY